MVADNAYFKYWYLLIHVHVLVDIQSTLCQHPVDTLYSDQLMAECQLSTNMKLLAKVHVHVYTVIQGGYSCILASLMVSKNRPLFLMVDGSCLSTVQCTYHFTFYIVHVTHMCLLLTKSNKFTFPENTVTLFWAFDFNFCYATYIHIMIHVFS